MDNQISDHWSLALELLKNEFSSVVYNTYIKDLEPLHIEKNQLYVKTFDTFHKTMLSSRYLNTINPILKQAFNQDISIIVITEKESIIPEKEQVKSITKNRGFLKSQYIFETFVRGKSNELAYAASVAVADAPGKTRFNPLFLYGGSGLGKTHLMHSVGNYVLDRDPDTRVVYVSTETFTNELISSIKSHKNQEFRNKYRDIDVLLIDDIQFLSEKEGTQEEFFHTFNTLYDANKQIVISSDQPPKDIKTLEERLTSRFGWGLIVDLTLPDFETRVAILEKKAELDNLNIPVDIMKLIAKNIVSNVRDLEGALNKVSAFTKLSNAELTIDLAEKALKDFISGKEKPIVTVNLIQEIVANYYALTSEDLRSKKRTQKIVLPRQIAMYLSYKILGTSLPKLGDLFGGRDHSTIIYGCNKIAAEIEKDPLLSDTIIKLEKKIMGE